jgi:molybdenum cofactor biosynthesis protein B
VSAANDFIPLSLCVLTVSDTRGPEQDSSGDYLAAALREAGHALHARALLPDDRYRLRAQVSQWIADDAVDGILVTGGTGFTGRDSTPEALLPLLDKEMPGFGELFRALSYAEIGAAAMLTRATAGVVDRRIVFLLPGSEHAVRLAMTKLILPELGHVVRELNR